MIELTCKAGHTGVPRVGRQYLPPAGHRYLLTARCASCGEYIKHLSHTRAAESLADLSERIPGGQASLFGVGGVL